MHANAALPPRQRSRLAVTSAALPGDDVKDRVRGPNGVHGLFLLCLALTGLPAAAQAPAPPQPPAVAQLAPAPAASEGRIHLDVVVTDRSGKPVSGLQAQDFTLLDNKQPAKILSFHAYGSAARPSYPPVQVVLIFDAVNFGYQAVSYVQYEVGQFLLQNGGHLAAPVGILWLTDDGIQVQSEPSTDGNALARQLKSAQRSLRYLNRTTGAYGAIERYQICVQMLNRLARLEARQPGRKLVIWMSSGWPMLDSPNINMSLKDQQDLFGNIVRLSGLLRQARISLYSIPYGMPNVYTHLYETYLKGVKRFNDAQIPDLSLRVLAVQSGGMALNPSNDLVASLNACMQDAGAYYTLSFDPPRADHPNEYHQIKVVVDRPNLTVRTNTGYYNQPAPLSAP